ncbi:MAG: hypothetical protein MUO72_09520 [Bacteroidales bacterium]|nr:hypothetical protein [Bacteroidales bacterium]
MLNFLLYQGLPDGLVQLPVPLTIRIGRLRYAVPQTLEEFTKTICYGQRIFLTQNEETEFGTIIRVIDGYYYSIVTKKKWDSDKALLFGKKVLTCTVNELYPVAMHLTNLIGEMTDREQQLLHREPSKMELAAGIEKLNVFSELTSLDFLRDAMKITVPEVLLTPYNECLVRFMIAKETTDYQNRYFELAKEEGKSKSKYMK